jgi:hypothetical protein
MNVEIVTFRKQPAVKLALTVGFVYAATLKRNLLYINSFSHLRRAGDIARMRLDTSLARVDSFRVRAGLL